MNIGNDVIIDDFIKIKHPDLAIIGNHIGIDFGFYCTTKLELGDYVHISPYVTCIGSKDGKFTAKGFNNISILQTLIIFIEDFTISAFMS